jgi:hypothetical protein
MPNGRQQRPTTGAADERRWTRIRTRSPREEQGSGTRDQLPQSAYSCSVCSVLSVASWAVVLYCGTNSICHKRLRGRDLRLSPFRCELSWLFASVSPRSCLCALCVLCGIVRRCAAAKRTQSQQLLGSHGVAMSRGEIMTAKVMFLPGGSIRTHRLSINSNL